MNSALSSQTVPAMPRAYTEDQPFEQPALGSFAEFGCELVFVAGIVRILDTSLQ